MGALKLAAGGFVLGLLLTGVGCQNNAPGTGGKMLNGKVSYQGKTLQYGTVILMAPSGKRHKAVIHTDGTYSMTRPDPGTYKVAVDTTVPPAALGGGPGGASPKKISLPAGTEDPEKSGMTAEVKESTTTHEIIVPEKPASVADKDEKPKDNKKDDAKKEETKKDDAAPVK